MATFKDCGPDPMGDFVKEVAELAGIPDDTGGVPLRLFRCGTCHGLYRVKDGAMEILAVQNDKPGNGHFGEFMKHILTYPVVRFLEMLNDGLAKHLCETRGFLMVGNNCEWRLKAKEIA